MVAALETHGPKLAEACGGAGEGLSAHAEVTEGWAGQGRAWRVMAVSPRVLSGSTGWGGEGAASQGARPLRACVVGGVSRGGASMLDPRWSGQLEGRPPGWTWSGGASSWAALGERWALQGPQTSGWQGLKS